jgi:hypothetical protein
MAAATDCAKPSSISVMLVDAPYIPPHAKVLSTSYVANLAILPVDDAAEARAAVRETWEHETSS